MTLLGILREAAQRSWEVLTADFLLELSIISPFLEFLIIPPPPHSNSQNPEPEGCPGVGVGGHSGLHLPPLPRFAL